MRTRLKNKFSRTTKIQSLNHRLRESHRPQIGNSPFGKAAVNSQRFSLGPAFPGFHCDSDRRFGQDLAIYL